MTATSTARTQPVLILEKTDQSANRISGLGWVFAAEGVAAALGFLALIDLGRTLGPASFAHLEFASASAAWMLVLVRGGFDVIVYREASRRPRLIAPLTNLLVALRCLAALIGSAIVLLIAVRIGPAGGLAVALAGLLLPVSAWVTDVGVRATGRLGWVAAAQIARSCGYVGAVFALVRGPGDLLPASACLTLGEILGAAVLLYEHSRDHGWPRPVWRRRASLILARRGAVAGLSRFGRVTLYGADLLILGAWLGGTIGPYAAARRIVFALVALGLVVPSMLGPSIARSWAMGRDPARARLASAYRWVWSLSLPAALGLILSADRWMPALFGRSYADGGPILALIAGRLPWVLAGSVAQAGLIACRREDRGLMLNLGQLLLAIFLLPTAILLAGPQGAAWATLVVEAAGAVAGWLMLANLGVAPGWWEQTGRAIVGSLGLIAASRLTRAMPLPVVVIAGAFAYGMAWRLGDRLASSRFGEGS